MVSLEMACDLQKKARDYAMQSSSTGEGRARTPYHGLAVFPWGTQDPGS